MTIKEIHLITFSPTHTSRQIGDAIARGVENVPVKIWDITLPDASIRTMTVAGWRKEKTAIGKRPCVFILGGRA